MRLAESVSEVLELVAGSIWPSFTVMNVPPESFQAHDRRFNSKGVPVVLAVLYFPRIGGAVKFMRLGTREMQLLRLLAPRDTSPSTVAWPQAPVSHQSHYWRDSCCPTWLLRVIFEAFEGLRNPINSTLFLWS